MNVKRWILGFGMVGVLVAVSTTAQARRAAPPPLAERFAAADIVVVGKVTSLEKKTVEAPLFDAMDEKVQFQIAVVKVSDPLKGAKGLTSIKIGFVPGKRIGRNPAVELTDGQEGCFMLVPHHKESFFILLNNDGSSILDKKSEEFDKHIAQFKRYGKILQEPVKSLTSKDAAERTSAACVLMAFYRNIPNGVAVKSEPLDAEQSKLILKALAEADWMGGDASGEVSPQRAFSRLPLTEKDGWKPGVFKNYAVEFPAAAKLWLKDNADKYRIQRIVPEKK